MKAVSPGWFWASGPAPASRYSAWLNKQHRAGSQSGRQGRGRGEARIEGSAQGTGALSPRSRLGGPDARGTEGARFFCFVPSEWGQLLLSGGLCPPSGETVQDPQSLNILPSLPRLSHTEPPSLSLTHPRPSISSFRSAGGVQCFVDAQESEQTSSQRKRGLLLCQLPGKKRFLLPLKRSL